MIEPNWNQERPSHSEIQEFWNGSIFDEVGVQIEGASKVCNELKSTHVNGGCDIFCATFINHPVLHWFVSRNRLDEISFFEKFLSSRVFGERQIKFEFDNNLEWEWSSSYILDGDIARTLKSGGAYKAFSGSGKEAKALGQLLCTDIFGERYDDIQIFKTYKPWSDWFYDVAWDQTWMIVDKRNLLIWAILLTDTD
ncbi:hypothetical protein [Iodobacter fluviatilis]|uniref:Uncharacterized protein n=1 Tax=Iodobacter fluviatilis TaxID=537 RepID=A0A377Q7I4_9NEIS|nr:hypothetical protein [Iodobacter fluviatilis]TCU89417.1 hypothetical protein EV682_102329 [Iodobacter fluviatilis]STQ90787.1 Uncharacterised protein [Iodobacter fluviatilis]